VKDLVKRDEQRVKFSRLLAPKSRFSAALAGKSGADCPVSRFV
jgi:hypothetical protein